jgi:hypothetical protein
MQVLQDHLGDANTITKFDLKVGFHSIRMLLRHKKYTAFGTQFRLFEYTVMPFRLPNVPATFQRDIHLILRPVLGIELFIYREIHIDKDEGMVVVAYVNDIIIATKGSLEKYRLQVGKVFDLVLENNMCIEIDKCVCEQTEASFLGSIVSGQSIGMYAPKA